MKKRRKGLLALSFVFLPSDRKSALSTTSISDWAMQPNSLMKRLQQLFMSATV